MQIPDDKKGKICLPIQISMIFSFVAMAYLWLKEFMILNGPISIFAFKSVAFS